MVGVLIIAHGFLGDALIDCATHVMGRRPEQFSQLGVTTGDDPASLLQQARKLVLSLDRGDGVLVFSDMFGGTPSNIARSLVEPGRVAGISGVNLPMLVRALTYRKQPLDVVVTKALSGGKEGVVLMQGELCYATEGR